MDVFQNCLVEISKLCLFNETLAIGVHLKVIEAVVQSVHWYRFGWDITIKYKG